MIVAGRRLLTCEINVAVWYKFFERMMQAKYSTKVLYLTF
jgi:hypothetical protein